MDYNSTLEFLYSQIPVFHRQGSSAYKPGLERVTELAAAFGNPHSHLKTIHIAGTNGKGSTAHSLAAIFAAAGYKTGLFTSPHIVDFRERIRINGQMIPHDDVIDFVNKAKPLIESLKPSFFELTTVMAFDYFARNNVEIAIIEVGLGGRLDSTNIILPEVSVITNISLDHTSLLGSTEEEIACEKAGIIKPGIPVVVGEAEGSVKTVFEEISNDKNSDIYFADKSQEINCITEHPSFIEYETLHYGTIKGELIGDFQKKNTATILEVISLINRLGKFSIGKDAIKTGLENVTELTGLKGRWMMISDNPTVVCDTGHNPGGWKYIAKILADRPGKKHLVIGFVDDKDVRTILGMISKIPDVGLYFTSPSTPRALSSEKLQSLARSYGLLGNAYPTVEEAYKTALANISDKSGEMLFVGGSNFVVADLLANLD